MKKKQSTSFRQHAKWLLFVIPLIAVVAITQLIIGTTPQKTAHGENNNIPIANLVAQNSNNNTKTIDSDSSKIFYPDLSKNIGVYILSKDMAPCKDYDNTIKKGVFGFRCKTLRSLYRGIWTKKIDTKGYNKLQIKARLTVNNYTNNYFAECNYKGVSNNDAVDLMALSSNPNPKLGAECNHEVPPSKWHHCEVSNQETSVITHCGIDKCSQSKSCDMVIDVTNKNEIYMALRVADDWFADVEGVLSGVKITLTK